MSKRKRLTTDVALRAKLQASCAASGGQNRWAAQHGVPQSLVSEVLTGQRAPSPTILAALGYRREIKVNYVPTDVWDDGSDAFGPTNPLERQK